MLCRIRDGVLSYHPGVLTLTIFSIVLLLILVHLAVVILIRNSAGGRHVTLSLFEGLLGLCIPLAFIAVLAFQKYTVVVEPGRIAQHIESPQDYELVVTDHSDSGNDKVYAVDWKNLRTGKVLQQEAWDFHIKVNVRYQHAMFANLLARQISRGKQTFGVTANQGYAVEQEIKMFSAKASDQNSAPGALIEIFDFDDESLGTFLLGGDVSQHIPSQEFQISGHTWSVELRNQRLDTGFQWQLVSGDSGLMIRFEEPAKEPVEQTIGFFHPANYQGFTFRIVPDPCDSQLMSESFRVSISRSFWRSVSVVVALITIAAAFVHCAVWLLRKEAKAA